VRAWLAERVAAVLPEYPSGDAVAYVIALHRHAVYATSSTHAALLAAEIAPERYSAEDAITAGEIVHTAGPGDWLAPSTANGPLASERTYKRADGTVRGHRDVKVWDSQGHTLHAREALERADMWALAHGAHLPALIGTDSNNWAEVVTLSGLTLTTVEGVTFAARPEGAGDSIVGDGRKRRGHRARTARYARRYYADEMTYLPWSHFLATGQRVIKRYRTALLISRTADRAERWLWLGHGAAVRRVTVPRAGKATGRTVETPIDVASDALAPALLAAHSNASLPSRYRVHRADGTTAVVKVDRANRRYVTTVHNADGTKARSQGRTLKAVLALVA